MNNQNITTASCTVNELFSNRIGNSLSGALSIPDYQRPYIWGKAEIDKLINDLIEHFSNSTNETPYYYLGSVILHKESTLLQVIDGQQRITTLSLILSALQSSITPALKFSSITSKQNIERNYAYILSRKEELVPFEMEILGNSNFTLVITAKEDKAYTFFETQNTGGVRLTGVDIIKAHHLRAVDGEDERGKQAHNWESSQVIDKVTNLLLKARFWGIVDWKTVPTKRDYIGQKQTIVSEFSEETGKHKNENVGYALLSANQDAVKLALPLHSFRYSIRQPLNDGHNSIDYFVGFAELYTKLFDVDKLESGTYKELLNEIILKNDGTGASYLKELFEISILCYAHKFGLENKVEAALWIFRSAYSLRLILDKAVKESSIPTFLFKTYPLLDIIIGSFSHEELIKKLAKFTYKVSTENTGSNTVKSRYIKRLADLFEIKVEDVAKIDRELVNKLKILK